MSWLSESKRHSLAAKGYKTGHYSSIKPMLLHRLKDELRDRPEWFCEIKHNGIRALIFKRGNKIKIQNRYLRDVTAQFPEIVAAISKIAGDFIIDGEIVYEKNGKEDFDTVVGKHNRQYDDGSKELVTFYGFDCLAVDDFDIEEEPIEERKKFLATILPDDDRLKLVEIEENEKELFDKTKGKYEGIVLKKHKSLYFEDKRSRDWLKAKHRFEADAYVIGYTMGEGNRENLFGSLILGQKDEAGKWVAVGKVGTGITFDELKSIKQKLDKLPDKDYGQKIEKEFREAERFFSPMKVRIKAKDTSKSGNFIEPVFVGFE